MSSSKVSISFSPLFSTVGMQEADAIRAFLQSAEEATHKAESAQLPFVRFGPADVNNGERAGLLLRLLKNKVI